MPIAARYRVSRRQLRSERPRTAPKAEGRTKRGTKGETLVVPEEASPLSAEVSATSIERRHHRQTTTRDTALISVRDRKSTRLNSSHVAISYAVFCLKKKKRLRVT